MVGVPVRERGRHGREVRQVGFRAGVLGTAAGATGTTRITQVPWVTRVVVLVDLVLGLDCLVNLAVLLVGTSQSVWAMH